MAKKKLAIIGNGMGTCRLLDELVARGGAEQFEISVFGEERFGAYNRIQLGKVLEGADPSVIETKGPEWYDRHGIRLLSGTRADKIDTLRKTILTSDGQTRSYDLVVLATGSQPLVPPFEGVFDEDRQLRAGAFVYRTISDCLEIRKACRPGDSAIVIGGGLLGLEAAKGLADKGVHTTVVHVSPVLMNAQLDGIGGEMLVRQMQRAGVFVRTGRTVEAVYGEERVRGVILDDGTTLPADLVVVACGVRPRVDLAKASGIPVNKGILVNDILATSIPSVYAFGECSEHDGKLYGLVAPVWDQAIVLADVLTRAKPDSRYRGSKIYSRLKVAGVDVASMGVLEPEYESDQVFQIIEERRSSYRKLILRDGKLAGAMVVGHPNSAANLVQLYDRSDRLPDDPLEVLCAARDSRAAGPRVVCNCNKVTDERIRELALEGVTTVEEMGLACKAGTGCGSCKNEIAEILLSIGPPKRATA